MPYEIRSVTAEELAALHAVLETAFGEEGNPDELEDERGYIELDRTLAAVEDGGFVGAAADYSFDLTLPGGNTIPVAGVTWVGVLPTHRRRGILTAMMDRQLDIVAERGEPVAILTASEGTIYGRFGYGLASFSTQFELDPRHGQFAVPVATAEGDRLRLLDKAAAEKVIPGVYDAYRRAQPGALSRNEGFWQIYFKDRESWRDGASPRFYVVHESASGEADGYAAYRIKQTWRDINGNTAIAMDVVAPDPDVEVTLWRYVFDLDLIRLVRGWNRPVDDALRWRLVDPRAYKVTRVHDWLWARLVDIPAALSARRYDVDGSVVFEVVDRFRPANDGRYRVEGGPDGATCVRTTDDADIAVGVSDLGAAYLGGVRLVALGRAGRARELTPGAIRRADAMFASTPLPHCTTPF